MITKETPLGVNQRIAARLRGLLGERDIKPAEMAEALNIKPQSARRRLKGEHDFKMNELEVIADWLGIGLASLVNPPPKESENDEGG